MNCRNVRKGLERGAHSPDLELHLSRCGDCQEYQSLQQWSRQVLLRGDFEVAPPPMSAIWASIHRAAEQSWDTALTLSFRRLLPYLVTITVLLLAVGGFLPGSSSTTSSRGAAVLLNTTDSMATVQAPDLTAQAPGDMLGLPGR